MISTPKEIARRRLVVDGNEAAARVAYQFSEIVSIFPITPSSPMAELCDEWAAAGQPNLWGDVPRVEQLQSEGGVAGAFHGSSMAGSLSTTFTASQGLLLMIPNMYKMAGELTPAVMHVTARAIATNGLSIFGDQSDVMACRQTGWAMLASNSVQEAHDMAAIAHAATIRSRIPFMHYFDGFRTSHEINGVEPLDTETLLALVDDQALEAFYEGALTPDHPSTRGTAHNPDTYFQSREAVNSYYKKVPGIVQDCMDEMAKLTGREYRIFDYYGAPDATSVIVAMGSGVETAVETVEYLNANFGTKYGVVAVHLYRPFFTKAFLECLPKSVERVAVLDRTKEPGSIGEPLYLDVVMALSKSASCFPGEFATPSVTIGGRYGLGSKEFTPAMVKAVFDQLNSEKPKDHFTIGIQDDVTETSLEYDSSFDIEPADNSAAVFYGLGSDGTVGANKNTIKIIGEATDLYAQAYFVYDSKKSGGLTTSHLRFGPQAIKAPYLINEANFVGCHQFQFLGRVKMLEHASKGAVFLLNSPYSADTVWDHLPRDVQELILEKELKFYVIDAFKLAGELGLGRRINTIMQVGFFALSGLLPVGEAIDRVKTAIKKTYGKKGQKIVDLNCSAVDAAAAKLEKVTLPSEATAEFAPVRWVPEDAPDFAHRVTASLLAGDGDLLPVSAFPADGVWPTGTSRFEKRRIATAIPVWDAETCTQCNKCSLFCPHAAIRPKVYEEGSLEGAPEGFKSVDYKGPGGTGKKLTLQVYPEDCTGCSACVELCPAKNAEGRRAIEMTPIEAVIEEEKLSLAFFESIEHQEFDPSKVSAKNLSYVEPLFEFSGACSGCTQTPYVRMLTQLFGDRMQIANATGCSSIYGGNLPTTPYCTNKQGKGPAWANSLFEDNAEFGLGLHLAAEQKRSSALRLLTELSDEVGHALTSDILSADTRSLAERSAQGRRIEALKEILSSLDSPKAKRLLKLSDSLMKKATWIVGGDGWAYDIGFGGLDHVLASGHNINVLVLDTEVYSNTGGQASKATPIGAIAKFAAAGKDAPKKDLGRLAISYGQVYVAQIALGANEQQALDALREAEAYDGPSLVICYSPCAAHGIDLVNGPKRQKDAVSSGYWPLYRYDPRNVAGDAPAFRLDSFEPSLPVSDFMSQENRFRSLQRSDPERAAALAVSAQKHVDTRWSELEALASAGLEDDDDDDGWG
ncbi:pyruvate:ferredoxin (flavodoxin) oxidoreductase [Pelagicoccus sp. SDUM812003]|uniref:pyruvate:ferredoxin (flavodoxin) oxidoreductase n=1 Tax=Pelagicoccus sp. SDUM812003 TaxID=3041267 RepID=UPI00280FD7EA|nr:pyruvate:ferredoxin (flavodoxin) oxidoreductase [Pelagicoccus sp. SDUM812003]MDQ8203650.1 pyruvate:ferredoxin (flavodoxin) oxidoreductase [Pelagicoccus sp. SDUM812003]